MSTSINQSYRLKYNKNNLSNNQLKDSNQNLNILTKENLVNSYNDSKLSAFSSRNKNNNTREGNSYYNSNSHKFCSTNTNNNNNILENNLVKSISSENSNIKINENELPLYLNDLDNKKYILENFFNEVHYEKDCNSKFIIYIRDVTVNSIDLTKVYIINSKNLFVLQIPFKNGKSQIFRIDYGKECIMKSYKFDVSDNILKIQINIEDDSQHKKIIRIVNHNKLIIMKKFFNYFKKRTNKKIIKESANIYYNRKLKRKIFNLLNYFFYIKIKENVNMIKVKKFVTKKSEFFKKILEQIRSKKIFDLNFKFRFLKFNLKIFCQKSINLRNKIRGTGYHISTATFKLKKFQQKRAKEKFFVVLRKELNMRILYVNNIKMANFLCDFFIKKKLYRLIKRNRDVSKRIWDKGIQFYKNKIKHKFIKGLLNIKHYMRRFYYNSNRYNFLNHLFLYLLVQRFLLLNKTDDLVISKENKNCESSFSTINNEENRFVLENSLINKYIGVEFLNIDNMENLNNSKNGNSNNKIYSFNKNCEFKLKTCFKNYIFSNYYNNNFHLPLIKSIFNVLRENWRKTKTTKYKFMNLVNKKIQNHQIKTIFATKEMRKRLKDHNLTQRKIFLNKFKIKLNKQKLQRIIKSRTENKINKLFLLNNFFYFLKRISRIKKERNYMKYRVMIFNKKLLKFRFFQFLSCLYMKRKIQRRVSELPYNNIIYRELTSSKNHQSNTATNLNNLHTNQYTQPNFNTNTNVNVQINSSTEELEYRFISKLISPKNFIKDLKERFNTFRRMLNLRLNYYKLIINCKSERIIKRKFQKFRDNSIKIYKNCFNRFKILLLDKKEIYFMKKKNCLKFFREVIDKIKLNKLNDFVNENHTSKLKQMSFFGIKNYFINKKEKKKKENKFIKNLKSIYYKFNYENFFLKNAETVKLKRYLENRLKKMKLKEVFKKLKKNFHVKNVILIGKKYLVKNGINFSLMLINSKNQIQKSSWIFSNKFKKYFFRILLRRLNKKKHMKKLYFKRDQFKKKSKKDSLKMFFNVYFSNKARNILDKRQNSLYIKKLFIVKLRSVLISTIKRNNKTKQFFKKILIKSLKYRTNTKKNNKNNYKQIREKFKNKVLFQFLIVQSLIARTQKFSRIIYSLFLKKIDKYYFQLINLLRENNKESLFMFRLKRIRIKEFLNKIISNRAEKYNIMKLSNKLNLKNFLKNFLNNILLLMMMSQKLKNLKENKCNFVIKNNYSHFIFISKRNLKRIFIDKNLVKFKNEATFKNIEKFFKIVKFNQKIKLLKTKKLFYFKKLIMEILSKFQKNQFIQSQMRISNKLLDQKYQKSFFILKNICKENSKKRMLKLKLETYKHKFNVTNNYKTLFNKIKKRISFKINLRDHYKTEINKYVKFDTDINNNSYQFNIEKYLNIDKIAKINSIKIFFNSLKIKISNKKKTKRLQISKRNNLIMINISQFFNIIKKEIDQKKSLKILFEKYIKKNLLKIFLKLKNEKVLISNQSFIENSMCSFKYNNNSSLNYSKSLKLKISSFFNIIKSKSLIKKMFGKFYEFKILFECKNFISQLKKKHENILKKKYFVNYFKIQDQIINYKVFLVKLQKLIGIKKYNLLNKKRKIFELFKINKENQKDLKSYLHEAMSMK